MRSPRLLTRSGSAAALAALLFAVVPSARAAFYVAEVDVKLTVSTPAIVNTFGFATFKGVGTPHENLPDGMADARATLVPKGIRGESYVFGSCVPVGATSSSADTSGLINLGNFSGGPPPTPPAMVVPVDLKLTYSYTVTAQAGPFEGAMAVIRFWFDAPGHAFMFEKTANADPGPASQTFSDSDEMTFQVLLPANMVSPAYLRTQAFGYCYCNEPPPPDPDPVRPRDPEPPELYVPYSVPEPSTLALAGTGGLVWGVRALRARRAGRNTSAARPPVRPPA